MLKMGCTFNKVKAVSVDEKIFEVQAILGGSDSEKPNMKRARYKEMKNYQAGHGNKKQKCSREHRKTKVDNKIMAKYDIKACISKGKNSRMFRVEHKISKHPFALKIIKATVKEESDVELSVLRRINHTNIVRLVEAFETNTKVYMVMELATGGSVVDYLETKGTYHEKGARSVINMVLSGVSYLHALGITHRNMTMENILYYHPGKYSKVMISNFEHASIRKPTGSPYMFTLGGTIMYIAPEVISGMPYTCAVDIWAIGVIAYAMISGSFPFHSHLESEILELIQNNDVTMTDRVWSNFSDESKAFIRLLLERNPQLRVTADAALQQPWFLKTDSKRHPSSGNSSGARSPDGSQQSSVSSVSSNVSQVSFVAGPRRAPVYFLQ